MRVLVVEDERGMRESLRQGLVHEGMVVDVAGDGLTGQWMAEQHPYDVVVLDIMLPRRNGYEVLTALRALGVWSPVLMLTAKDGDYDQTDAFELGADDYLIKPFSFLVLVARLHALARRGAPERPVVLVCGDLVLDPTTRKVTCCTRDVPLTAKQYAVLHFLVRRQGEVVSKQEILDNVWDSAFEGSDNLVEVYVANLRKKLDAPFDRHSLETVRGAGYRLLATVTGPPTA
ncbi:response regulator transcription factor [Cellulomonas soli]|uniref:DNA-binding response regulator n=1 Tax=Cellulomonas soli TaxID=931535 RepID=A0A512PHH3_9CELL|nr:response regulator transcription factor [Cellulomonas soli]NYI60779.1 DNA-binding response OmpR family regulator [Cellulomonas soli]GEP70637.1 DNA-binding response regulator [Cellulomonas soli]